MELGDHDMNFEICEIGILDPLEVTIVRNLQGFDDYIRWTWCFELQIDVAQWPSGVLRTSAARFLLIHNHTFDFW